MIFFEKDELYCPCCGYGNFGETFRESVRIILERYGEINIHSGARCKSHNDSLKNSSDISKHLTSKAIDFSVYQTKNESVYEFLDNVFPNSCGIIIYNWGIHFDVRPGRYRSDKRAT